MPTPAAVPSILIFAGTYLVLALGRLPGFRVGRTGAAIIGATLMVAVNALTRPEAVEAINTFLRSGVVAAWASDSRLRFWISNDALGGNKTRVLRGPVLARGGWDGRR